MPGAAYVAARIVEPGLIRHTSEMSSIVFGEADGSMSERARRFQAACRDAAFVAEVSADVVKALWSKFVLLATNSALTCLARQNVARIYRNDELRSLAIDAMHEVVAVTLAQGVRLDDDLIDRAVALSDSFPEEMTTSMHNDLKHGRPLEVAGLSGLVARLGDELGVATPIHRTGWAGLKPFAQGGA